MVYPGTARPCPFNHALTKQAAGVTFRGKEAVTSYPGEEWTRSILACSGKDKGVVVITFIEKNQYTRMSGI